MKRLLFVLLVGATVAAWPAGAGAATFKGVVVGKLRGSVLVASPAGLVSALSGKAKIGSRVESVGGRLVIVGHATTTRIRGIVFRRIGATTFISSGGHLLAVHSARRLATANDTSPPAAGPGTPAPGTVVTAQVGITDNGQLDEQSEDDVGTTSAGTIPVQAVVAAVGAGTVTLTVNGQSLTVPLPAGLTLPSSIVGQTVTLNLSLGGDDQGESSDSGSSGGDDSSGTGGGD